MKKRTLASITNVCQVMLMETNGITTGFVKYREQIASFLPKGASVLEKINNFLGRLNSAGVVSLSSGTDIQYCYPHLKFARYSA